MATSVRYPAVADKATRSAHARANDTNNSAAADATTLDLGSPLGT